MLSLSLPLRIEREGLGRESNPKRAVTSFIHLLITTHLGDALCDGRFGFLLNNLKFQNFDESNGVVFGQTGRFGKKISGSSRNIDTFAAELRDTITAYETRLKDVSVSMTYTRIEKVIYVTVKGVIVETEEDFQYDTTIKVWN